MHKPQRVIALVMGLVLLLPFSAVLAQTERPNIIFIFADDLGYGDLSSYGSTTIHTPNLDQLAESGIKFTEFYSASSVCSPARGALLTGRYPARLGIEHVFMYDSPDGMDPSEITIAEQLKIAGYSTGMVGKWHLGSQDRYMPWQQGFDEFYGVPFSNDMGNLFFYENREPLYEEIDQHYLTQRYTRKAIDFIRRHRDQHFFLYLAHSMPHVPIYASPDFEGTSKGGLYGDVVEELDWSTGEIIKELEVLGLRENTLVVFSSDNGPWLLLQDNGGSTGELRDGKGTAFEGGQRVPTIASWPAVIAPGRVESKMATMMDWFPTFSTLVGVTLPSDRVIDGRDISGVLKGTGARSDQQFFYQGSRGSNTVALRDGDWKLKLTRKGYPRFLEGILHAGFYAHGTLLFNLAEDPNESNNLAEQYPERVQIMSEAIADFEASLGRENIRQRIMRGTASDRKGYEVLLKPLLILGLPLLLILVAILYACYRLLRLAVRRLRKV